MKVYATIQARMGSSKFPGKQLKPLYEEQSVLKVMHDRVKICADIDHVTILTTFNKYDDEIVRECNDWDMLCFRGDEDDVMNRMVDFCKELDDEDIIVDLTGDCPLVCPYLIRAYLALFGDYNYDYLSNTMTRSYPDGFDIQIYKVKHIKAINKYVEGPHRSHTGWNIVHHSWRLNSWDRNKGIKLGNLPAPLSLCFPSWGLTLDEPDDLVVIKKLFQYFKGIDFMAKDAIEYLKQNKHILLINKGVKRKVPGEG